MLNSIVILLLEEQASCYLFKNGEWSVKTIDQEQCNRIDFNESSAPLKRLLASLSNSFNRENCLADYVLTLVYDAGTHTALRAIQETLSADNIKNTTWQVVRYEPLLDNCVSDVITPPLHGHDVKWNCRYLLPLLAAMLHPQVPNTDSVSNEADGSQLEKIKILESKIRQLEQSKSERLATNTFNGSTEFEQLLRFLPLFFRQFWSRVSPVDLRHILGRSELIQIQSPQDEPSLNAIAILKRQFKSLPVSYQELMIDLCHQLHSQYNIDVRPEMSDYFKDQ